MNLKKLIATSMAIICMASIGSFPVSAAEITLNAPTIVQEVSEETGNPIIEMKKGIYSVGDRVFVDIEVAEPTEIEIPEVVPYGSTPPGKNTVWNWSDGSYSGSFECKYRVYTEYRFTGYSTYNVTASGSYTGYPTHMNNGYFSVIAIQDNNGWGASYDIEGDGYASIDFFNCKPTEKLAFLIQKTDDGFWMSGRIAVEGV